VQQQPQVPLQEMPQPKHQLLLHLALMQHRQIMSSAITKNSGNGTGTIPDLIARLSPDLAALPWKLTPGYLFRISRHLLPDERP
jgi:hypothetical protein